MNTYLTLVSVIIPVYNVEQYLDRCLESIVNQTYPNIEIILVNDGSSDQSGIICDKWSQEDQRIKVIHIINQGVSLARNLGIKKSTGEWLYFVDSDDYISLDAIEILVNQIDVNIGIIEGNTRFLAHTQFDNYDTTFFKRPKSVCYRDLFKSFYYKKILISPWNKLIRRDIVESSLFSPNRIGEDVKFVLELSIYMEERHLHMIQVPNVLYFYTINNYGIMQSKTARLRLDSRYCVYDAATKYFNLFGHLTSRRIFLDMWENILNIRNEFDNEKSCLYGCEDLRKEWVSFEMTLPNEKLKNAKGPFCIWLIEKKFSDKLNYIKTCLYENYYRYAKRIYLCFCRRVLSQNV